MQKYGCCNWCLTIVKAPDDYDRKVHTLFCSPQCYWLNWIFKRWQTDEWLEWKTKRYKDEGNGSQTPNGTPPPPPQK